MEIFGISFGYAALWIIAAVILIIIEALTLGLNTIWFAGGALVAAFSTLFTDSIYIQIVIFVVVSIVLLYSTKPLKGKLKIGNEKTNAEALVGTTGFVVETITPQAFGQVKVSGQPWTAMSANPNETIEAGEEVTIAGIEGVKLIVVPTATNGINITSDLSREINKERK